MAIKHLGQVALLPVLTYLILLSNIQGFSVQPSYATQQEVGVRTLSIKVVLENSVVEQGETQTIHFQLADQKSHQPIGGAVTSATVTYANGETVRHFSVLTDESGRSSISWKIERDAPPGRYNLVYSAFETGYVSESFGGSFSVVTESINICLSSSSSSFDSSSLVLDMAGPSTHIIRNQTSQTCSATSSG